MFVELRIREFRRWMKFSCYSQVFSSNADAVRSRRLTGLQSADESASSFTIGLVRFVDTKMSIARRLSPCKRASRSCSWISGIDGRL